MNHRCHAAKAALGVVLISCAVDPASASSISFPDNPTTIAECDRAEAQGRLIEKQHYARYLEYGQRSRDASRQNMARCPTSLGSGKWERCLAPGMPEIKRLEAASAQAHQESMTASRETTTMARACRQTANAHIQQEQRQKDAAERSRRESESRQRQAQAQAQEAQQRQQREKQNENDRREREAAHAKSEALRRQQAAELERANRSQPRAPESRVIMQAPPSYQDRTPGPRIVQTPQMRAAAEAEARQQKNADEAQIRAQEAKALQAIGKQLIGSATGSAGAELKESADLPTQLVGKGGLSAGKKLGAEARKDVLDSAFNPNGDSDAGVNRVVKDASRLSRSVEKTPLSNPVAGQMQRDALEGIGSNANRATGDINRAFKEFDRSNAPPPAQSTGGGAGSGLSVPMRPMIGSGATNAAADRSGTPSANSGVSPDRTKSTLAPIRMCVTLPLQEREQCMVDLCGSEKWRAHIDCANERR